MTPQQEMLNRFLVDVFGDILRLEEASLRKHCPNLSVTELHVLEAVAACAGENERRHGRDRLFPGRNGGHCNGVSENTGAERLPGAHSCHDRPAAGFVTLTEKAYPVLRQHALFHQRMVEQVSNTLPNDQLDTLCQALETLHSYFLSSRDI